MQKKPLLRRSLIEKRYYTNPLELGAVLQEMSLGRQAMIQTQAHFLAGALDTKFLSLYQRRGLPTTTISNAGHTVLLENPQECAFHIKSRLYAK